MLFLLFLGWDKAFVETEIHNPYASSAGSLQNAGESEHEYRLQLFSSKQILAASVIGHVVPASMLIAANYYIIADYKKATITVIIGLAYTIVFLLANDALAVDYIIPYLLLSNAVVYLAPRLIFDKYILCEEQLRPMWMVAISSIVGLILQCFAYAFVKLNFQDAL